MAWIILASAGFLEIGFAFGMKWSAGFTRLIPSAVYGCYRLVECLSSLTRAPHTSSGNRLRGLDRYRRRRYRDYGYRSAGRLRIAGAGALYCFHCWGRDWAEACLGNLRTAGRGNPVVSILCGGSPRSALGLSRRFGDVRATSALPLIADVRCEDQQIRKVPETDMGRRGRN